MREVEELENSVSELENEKQKDEICILKEKANKHVFSIEHMKSTSNAMRHSSLL
jgi:hypothetical protein